LKRGTIARYVLTGLASILLLSAPSALKAQERRAILAVTITEETTGMPVADVEYSIPATGIRGVSNDRGHFKLTLGPGHHHLLLHRMGYEQINMVIDLLGDTTLLVTMRASPFALREVVVRSAAFDGSASASPLNTVVLDRERLERDQHSTFSQGLERVPGVNSITTGVGIAKPVIRGMQGNRIAVNDHGVRQEGQQWGSDHGLEIDPYNVDRVEILRGAASLMHGSDAMGGVINILEPVLEPVGAYSSSVTGVFRGNNDHVGLSAAAAGRPGDHFFQVRLTRQEYGDYRVPADGFVYNRFVLPIDARRLKNTAGREMHVAATAGRVLPKGTVRLTVSNYHQVTGLFPGAVGIPRAYTLRDDGDRRNADIPRQTIDHLRAVVNLRHQVGRHSRIEADAGYQMNLRREESFPHSHGLGPRPEGTLAHGLDLRTGTFNMRLHTMRGSRWNGAAGLTSQAQRNRRDGFEFILGDHRSMQGGIFAMAEHQASERTTVQFGLRGDMARLRVEPFFMPVYAPPAEIIGEVQRGAAVDAVYAAPSGAVGIAHKPRPSLTLKANAGRTFRFPTAPELTMNGVHHGTFRHEQGDPTLRPETGWQLDLGAYHAQGPWHISLTPFLYAFDNYIFLRPTAVFSPLPEAGQLYRYTETSALQAGGELEVRWNGPSGLELGSSLEYVVNENRANGLALPFTPPLLSRTEAQWTMVRSGPRELRLITELVLSAAQERTDRNEPSTPGYALVNAGVSLTTTWGRNKLHFMLHVRNVGDTHYLMHLSRYRILNLPEPGRNIMFSLRLDTS